MKSQRERDQEARRVKLEEIEEQVRRGSLTIRAMTPEEREKFRRPERPERPRPRRRW
jgi:hypothetical protein